MHWHTVYEHLVANGLYRDFVSAVVISTVGFFVGLFFALKPFRKLKNKVEGIRDSLDTSTPGGLTEIEKTLKEIRDTLGAKKPPPDKAEASEQILGSPPVRASMTQWSSPEVPPHGLLGLFLDSWIDFSEARI